MLCDLAVEPAAVLLLGWEGWQHANIYARLGTISAADVV
jgi:hypothetical protein